MPPTEMTSELVNKLLAQERVVPGEFILQINLRKLQITGSSCAEVGQALR